MLTSKDVYKIYNVDFKKFTGDMKRDVRKHCKRNGSSEAMRKYKLSEYELQMCMRMTD